MKPIIGIVARPNQSISKREIYSISEPIRKAILANEGIPIGIVPTGDMNRVIDLCDGIIFPGGTDYIEHDFEVLSYAFEKDLPVLGVCLGMQTMGVFDGAECIKIIPGTVNHNQEDGKQVHTVLVDPDSYLYQTIKMINPVVNSRHQEMITSDLKTLNIVAMSEDGIIEAVENKDKLFWLGVQWHPEILLEQEAQKNIFRDFIKKSIEYQQKRQ